MTLLEQQLATALAEAVNDQATQAERWKIMHESPYSFRHWYAPAVQALAAYSAERDKK